MLPGSINVGSAVVNEYHTLTRGEEQLTLLTPTDAVRDRLCSYYFWNERSGLRAALQIAETHVDEIDFELLRKWSDSEARGPFGANVRARFEEFLRLFHHKQTRGI